LQVKLPRCLSCEPAPALIILSNLSILDLKEALRLFSPARSELTLTWTPPASGTDIAEFLQGGGLLSLQGRGRGDPTSQLTELFRAYLTGLLGLRLILVQETNLLPAAAPLEVSDGWESLSALWVRNEGSNDRRRSGLSGWESGTLEVSSPPFVFLLISAPDTEIIDLSRFLLSFSQLGGVRPTLDWGEPRLMLSLCLRRLSSPGLSGGGTSLFSREGGGGGGETATDATDAGETTGATGATDAAGSFLQRGGLLQTEPSGDTETPESQESFLFRSEEPSRSSSFFLLTGGDFSALKV